MALREDAAGQPRLVGYVVERPGAVVAFAALHERLAQRLPDYMIPTAWKRLDALPLTPNGKLDRAALPAVEHKPVAAKDDAVPRTPTEVKLALLWMEVLRLESVGRDDDLFALGADSIQVFGIAARANRRGMPLTAKLLFAHRTIAKLGRRLDMDSAVLAECSA